MLHAETPGLTGTAWGPLKFDSAKFQGSMVAPTNWNIYV